MVETEKIDHPPFKRSNSTPFLLSCGVSLSSLPMPNILNHLSVLLTSFDPIATKEEATLLFNIYHPNFRVRLWDKSIHTDGSRRLHRLEIRPSTHCKLFSDYQPNRSVGVLWSFTGGQKSSKWLGRCHSEQRKTNQWKLINSSFSTPPDDARGFIRPHPPNPPPSDE